MTPEAIPHLPRGVRTHWDRVRETYVLLGPERVLMLDPVGEAILGAVDGRRSIAAISADLARKYAAPEEQIQGDVIDYLGDLADKRPVEVADG